MRSKQPFLAATLLLMLLTALVSPAHSQSAELPFTIDALRARDYPGGAIKALTLVAQNTAYSRIAIAYDSDGLTITGMMNIPAGAGPFPVVILLHGYYDRALYRSGIATQDAADFFARRGYLTLAPDFRGWGGSDNGPNLFATGLTIDTLNLISALATLPQADRARVFLWGHSMGGGVATKTLVLSSAIRAAALHAPNSPDDADLIARWGPACRPGESEARGDKRNPAEALPANTAPDLAAAYYATAADPNRMRAVAPIYHLEHVSAPVQIHIGLADGAALGETPPEWSEKLRDALVAAGKDVALFAYPGQGHFLTGADWLLMMERALAFFEEQVAK